jgi:beta-glucosidase
VPGHANDYYINEILKGELKFEGFVVSDWEDIKRLYLRDKIADSPEEAVRIAVMAGLDQSIVPNDFSFYDLCLNLTYKDAAFLKRVNDAVTRILNVKEKLGLWQNSSLYPSKEEINIIGNDEFHEKNLNAAHESIILAKNDANILPLNPKDSKKILVVGPTGNLVKVLNGGWTYTWQGDNETNYQMFGRKKFTVFEALQKLYSSQINFTEGVNFENKTNFDETIMLANNFDILILCTGEYTYSESPGNINNLFLNQPQYDLAKALYKTRKPIILVYLGGRPRIITEMVQKSSAVLLGFLPGNRGGEAIANIIFGLYNPNGKLPMTYPYSPNGIFTYDYKPLERCIPNPDPLVLSKCFPENLFPFGHGLSYTNFTYSSLRLSAKEIQSPNGLSVSIDVENVGRMEGMETVILYLNDEYGSVSRPVKEVKGFQKINLKVNEKRTVTFDLEYLDFSFINQYNKRIVEEGDFYVYINNYDGNATFYLRV